MGGGGNFRYPYKYVAKVLHFSKICKFFSKKKQKKSLFVQCGWQKGSLVHARAVVGRLRGKKTKKHSN